MKVLIIFLLGFIAAKSQQSDFRGISFNKADSIAAMFPKENIKNLPVLAHNLTQNLPSDVERFRSIYKWVCLNVENDYHSYLQTMNRRKKWINDSTNYLLWNQKQLPIIFKKLIQSQKTTCTGYAYLIKELANLANLECKILNGYARTAFGGSLTKGIPNHSWNAIKLNGQWYLCDATWSAGKIQFDKSFPIFKKNYIDGYFLADPNLFIKNHYPENPVWSLLQNPPSLSSFFQNPIVYEAAFQKAIIPTYPVNMNLEITTLDSLLFMVHSKKTLDNSEIKILAKGKGNQIRISPAIKAKEGTYILNFNFNKSGFYDVHLIINDQAIATYTANVSKTKIKEQ